jgi:translation initiation factor 2 subunit 2
MSEKPLFDPSLKKRKKKTVVFSQDPLEAHPAPTFNDSHSANGDAVDLGPTTIHEQMKTGEGADEKNEDDDFKAMLGDFKKKKKKKEIPLDFVGRIFVMVPTHLI